MKLRVDLVTGTVHHMTGEEWRRCPHNGQHHQLPGYVLAEVMGSGDMHLFHPDTDPTQSGHIDVIYSQEEVSNKQGHGLHQYYHRTGFPFDDPAISDALWPTGLSSLIMTILRIEEFIQKETGVPPTFENFLVDAIASWRPEPVVVP